MYTSGMLKKRKPTWLPSGAGQISATLAGGMAVFLFLSLFLATAFGVFYVGRIYPGISVAGVSVGGLRPAAAAQELAQRLTFPQTGKIVFKDGSQVWMATPGALGLSLDANASAQAAYQLGRSGGMLSRLWQRYTAWSRGLDVAPTLAYDERLAQAYLEQIAQEVNRPTQEATLKVSGLEVTALPGQVGRTLDMAQTLLALRYHLPTLTDGLLILVVKETEPAILDTSQQEAAARSILSAPLTLQIPQAQAGDPGPWLIPRDQLATMLVIERVESSAGAHYQVGLDEKLLGAYLERRGAEINRYASNARFIFNDEEKKLEVIRPAVVGRTLDVAASIQAVNQSLAKGEHLALLVMTVSQPQIGDDVSADELGVKEQIIAYTTYFRGSTKERLQNIETAAANFHGLLVPPGATFSMADVMGMVSLDTGYAEAWIIYGGRTIKGVGGGVCQVSTTLFRTVFFAGYPILERYPHAYRVGYYEQTRTGYNSSLAGLDATVFVPVVDFKFQNDTPYWLLMETYFNATARSLTWKIYSTSDGRTVEWETTGPQNVVEAPDPLYEENPDLPTGVIKQVDWAAEGADVTVTRKVYRDGELLYLDTFTTHYQPWQDVFQYGPGTDLPNSGGDPLKIKKKKGQPQGWVEIISED